MPRNRIVEEVQQVRKRLVEKHGGFDAYFEHLLQLDQQRLKAETAKKVRKQTVTGPAKLAAKSKTSSQKAVVAKRTTKRKAS